MIDFVKISIDGCNKERLLNSDRLQFKRKVVTKTGEFENKQVAQFHCMDLHVMDSGYTELTGSIHKAFNSISAIQAPHQTKKMKGFNGNQFNYTQLRYVLNWLIELIEFDPNKSTLRNIEFGANIESSFDVPLILCNLMRHNGKPFLNPLTYYHQAEHYEYKVKCYFKSAQYKTPDNLMRFELQYKTIRNVNELGMITVSDLYDKSKLDALKGSLIQSWNEVILYDYTICESELVPTDQKWLVQYRNANYWNVELKSNRLDPHKKRLKRITKNHSDEIQKQISLEIEKTWTRLNVHCDTFNALFGRRRNNSAFNYSMNAYTIPWAKNG